MALVTAQLLFIEEPDPRSVLLDVIVLDRVETTVSPELGAPLTFGFGLPDDEEDRARVLTVLGNWTRRGVAMDMAIRTRHGIDEVELRSGVASITLEPRVVHGAP